MTKEDLDSDKVNYMIWRYLQESNYRETAAKLQSEWNVKDPESLNFAPHVQAHTLVAILQRGLLYHEAERQIQARRKPCFVSNVGFFGPVPPLSPPLAAEDDPVNVRKRTSEERPQQSRQESPAKRTKLTNGNGHENGIEPTPMELDDADATDSHSNNGHVYPSPGGEEDNATENGLMVANGVEISTQAAKVRNLSKDAKTLHLAPDSAAFPKLTHCEWNPQDVRSLVTAGEHSHAISWRIGEFKGIGQDGVLNSQGDGLFAEADASTIGIVSAVSWTATGQKLAVASTHQGKAKITIMSKNWKVLAQLNVAGNPPIVCLRWNADNHRLLALTSCGVGVSSWITIYEVVNRDIEDSKPFDLGHIQPWDAQWIGDDSFAVCGGDKVFAFQAPGLVPLEGEIVKIQEYCGSSSPISLDYDPTSKLLAASNEDGTVVVWDSPDKPKSARHDAAITSIKWQPHGADEEPMLASSDDNGNIKIWRMGPLNLEEAHTVRMTSDVVGLAFSPRGNLLAAATNTQVSVWNMKGGVPPTAPEASWLRPNQEVGWQSPKSLDGAEGAEDIYCLSWDAQGSKLAYGVNSRIVILDYDSPTSSINKSAP